MQSLTLNFLVLSFFSLNVFANTPNTINCRPAFEISDAGEHVDIQLEGAKYNYTFYSDSYRGRVVHRQKVVSISSLTTESSCKLSIYSGESASNTAPMFYIYKDSNSSDWRLLPEGNSAAPKLICNLDAEFENKMCSEESSAR